MMPETEPPDVGERTEDASTVTLEAAGIDHTLHILEGIASEGKEWLARKYRRL